MTGKIGIYMRLSRDDEKAGESMSIENQRIILRNFVKERGGTVAEEYVDDGWSGTSFERPAIKRLLADAQSGIIDTIIVKDLSRFGRNYIQVGQYVDYIFPAYGVRFIAINDNVDTADRGSAAMDMMPIMNVFNEWHAANTSKKIRAVLEAGQRSGKYTGWSYPYGYKAGDDENRTAVIDERAAAVVRRIFDLRLSGVSIRGICRILAGECVPNPATYSGRASGNFSPLWCAKTVASILSDPTYIGCTVQHRTTSVSYKNRKVVKIPEAERIVKENAHEPIISRDVWEGVQAMKNSVSRGKCDKGSKLHALSGLLVCADCGKKMRLKTTGGHAAFVCRTYTDLGRKYCSSHALPEAEIEDVILRDIRDMLGGVTVDCGRARERYLRERAQRGDADGQSLKELRRRLAELDKLTSAAFEARVLGSMPESVCVGLLEKYEKERLAVSERIEAIGKRREAESGDADGYVKRLTSYAACDELTRELCVQLIKFVTVGEKRDGARSVEIYYDLE